LDSVALDATGDRRTVELAARAIGRDLRVAVKAQARLHAREIRASIGKLDLAMHGRSLALAEPADIVFRPGRSLEVRRARVRALGGDLDLQASVLLPRHKRQPPRISASLTARHLALRDIATRQVSAGTLDLEVR